MSDNSKIEWTEATWSWVTGCTKISDGCLNCYIQTTPPFRIEHRKFSGPDIGAFTGLKLYSDRLWWPRRWRRPRKVFVNSLGDTFHGDVPRDLIAEAFAVMAVCPQHTFQVLTKRHMRMRSLLSDPEFAEDVRTLAWQMDGHTARRVAWPLPNVWLGVSAEDQHWADIRIPALLRTPAAVRFVSAEPLLGRVDLRGHLAGWCPEHDFDGGFCVQRNHPGVRRLGWLIIGGESGPGARRMDEEWARTLAVQATRARVPFFMKQMGTVLGKELGAGPKGADWDRWPDDLQIREFPDVPGAVAA